MKRRLLSLGISGLVAASALVAQPVVPISTFSITGLNAKVASTSLPDGTKASLISKLDNAQAAYSSGRSNAVVGILGAFGQEVAAQRGKHIPSSTADEFTLAANWIVLALHSGAHLGGSEVGTDGAVLQVSDPNSPAFGAQLTIPANALATPSFISLTVADEKPDNPILTVPGSGLALGPEGLALSAPATLTIPYPDANADGIVDGTNIRVEFLKVGMQDALGRISFPPRSLDTKNHTQSVQISHFSFYWNVGWYWGNGGTLTYKFLWPEGGVRIAPGYDLDALKEGVRQAIHDWEPAIQEAGFTFQEVPADQPASFQFAFFDPWSPMVLDGNIYAQDVSGVGFVFEGSFYGEWPRQPVWVYSNGGAGAAGAWFDIRFNTDFGFYSGGPNLAWTADTNGSSSAISIQAVAVHAIGHVLGLNDTAETPQPPVMAALADLSSPQICLFPADHNNLRNLYALPPSQSLVCPHAGIAVTPSSFDFGTVFTGAATATTITIRNNGTGTLIVDGISITSGDFELYTSSLASYVRPGRTTAFTINFAPSGAGPRQAAVWVYSNAPASAILITVTGTGAIPMPDLKITKSASPNPVASGKTVTYSIHVQNVGTATANAVTVTDTLSDGQAFSSCTTSVGQCPSPASATVLAALGNLAPSAAATVTITATAPTVSTAALISNTATAKAGSIEKTSTPVSITVNPPPPPPPSAPVGGGPPGGAIRAIAIDPIHSSTVFAGTSGAGVFKSQDGGQTWNPTPLGSSGAFVVSIAINPVDPTIVYAGTGAGVFKTTTGGLSWTSALNKSAASLAIDPRSPATVYAGTNEGVFQSVDAGESWLGVNLGLSNLDVRALAIDPVNTLTLYAATAGGGVFKTVNAGENWTSVASGLGASWVLSLAVDPLHPETVYAGTSGPPGSANSGVFKSTNGGASWAAVNTGLQAGEVYALAIDPLNPDILYAGTWAFRVFKSTNAGATWSSASSGISDHYVLALAIDPAHPNTLYAGGYGEGVLKSTDAAASWSRANSGLAASWAWALAIDPSNSLNVYAGTFGGGVFRSGDGGSHWASANQGISEPYITHLALNRSRPNTLYAGAGSSMGSAVFKTTSQGMAWSRISLSAQAPYGGGFVAIDPVNPDTIYWAVRGVYKSLDGGGTWVSANSGLPTNITALAINPITPTSLFAASADTIFRSNDGGASWALVGSSLGVTSISAFAIDPVHPVVIYAGGAGGVLKSSDGGGTWSLSNSGITVPYISALVVNPINTQIVYAAAQYGGGIYKSTDGGATWTRLPKDLMPNGVTSLVIDPANPNTIYAGPYLCCGVFKSTDGGATWQPTGAN